MMTRRFRLIIAFLFSILELSAQPESVNPYSSFPIVVTLQFHALAMPVNNLKANFSNVGIGVGTELSYNGKQNFTQQVHAVWYRNRAVGNGVLIYTQPSWRPTLAKNFYGELKVGAGYLYSFRPVESFKQVNGNWVSVAHKGKGMFTIPVGVSLGYNSSFQGYTVSPFISYQFLIVNGYNTSLPVIPETLIQVGSRIHLN